MEAVWLPHPDVWGTKISCVLIALRLGPINSSLNTEWAHVSRISLYYAMYSGTLLALYAFSI